MLLENIYDLRNTIVMDVPFGPPCAGKGALTELVSLAAVDYGVVRIGSSDLIREHIEHKTEIGLEFKKCQTDMALRGLAADKPMLKAINSKVYDMFHQFGVTKFVFDGFPRNPEQGENLLACRARIRSYEIKLDETAIRLQDQERCLAEKRIDNGQINNGLSVFNAETKPAMEMFARRGPDWHHTIDGTHPIRDKVKLMLVKMGFQTTEIETMMGHLDEQGHPAHVKYQKIESRRAEFLKNLNGPVAIAPSVFLQGPVRMATSAA